jgi:hypothetical protein
MKKSWQRPAIVLRLPLQKDEYTVLPAKKDEQGKLVRSYPGAPDVIGWTVFLYNPKSCEHTGDPIFETERAAKKFLREWRGVTIRLNWNPCEPRGL